MEAAALLAWGAVVVAGVPLATQRRDSGSLAQRPPSGADLRPAMDECRSVTRFVARPETVRGPVGGARVRTRTWRQRGVRPTLASPL